MIPQKILDGQRIKGAFALILFGLVVLLIARQVYAAENYSDPNYPRYSGNFASEDNDRTETLTVVSYNIRYARNIEQAITELKEIKLNNGLDVVLLQEMDEAGTEQIARALEFNFVYFPAAIEPRNGNDFGNAILSRWSITDPQKLILPHKSLSSGMNRTATRATINVNNADILAYSIHTETILTLPKFREDQFMAVLDNIGSEAKFVIIGGDFNTVTLADAKEIEENYSQAGLMRASEGSGYTVIKYGVEAFADLIFSKGFVVEESGKIENATASDHLPIWVTLALK